MEVVVDNWSYKTCKSSSQKVTTNKPTPSFFTGRMPFRQSTEGKCRAKYNTMMSCHHHCTVSGMRRNNGTRSKTHNQPCQMMPWSTATSTLSWMRYWSMSRWKMLSICCWCSFASISLHSSLFRACIKPCQQHTGVLIITVSWLVSWSFFYGIFSTSRLYRAIGVWNILGII